MESRLEAVNETSSLKRLNVGVILLWVVGGFEKRCVVWVVEDGVASECTRLANRCARDTASRGADLCARELVGGSPTFFDHGRAIVAFYTRSTGGRVAPS